jgi:MFS family permease
LLNLKFLTKDLKVSRRKFAAVTILTSGTLAWFFLLNLYLSDIFKSIAPNEPTWAYFNVGQILCYGFTIFWAVIGSFISKGINRCGLLISWILLGALSTIFLALFQGPIFVVISSLLLGLSLGLGFPIIMAFVADSTVIEERARVSGIIIVGTFVLAFIALAVVRTLSLGILGTLVLFAAVRLISLVALVIDNCDGKEEKNVESPRLPKVVYREYVFYLFPWMMFIIAAGLAGNLIPETIRQSPEFYLGTTLRYACIAIFGLVAGVAADRFGRKPPIITGLIMLGVSFALLGFNMSPTSVLIYLLVSGMAWGLFFVIFLAVPGDLSVSGAREKSYALGYILPLAIYFGLSTVPGEGFFSGFPASALSQVFSIILFLSIIPILRSKETLPREKIQDRKMKEHLEKIEELIQESKKNK